MRRLQISGSLGERYIKLGDIGLDHAGLPVMHEACELRCIAIGLC